MKKNKIVEAVHQIPHLKSAPTTGTKAQMATPQNVVKMGKLPKTQKDFDRIEAHLNAKVAPRKSKAPRGLSQFRWDVANEINDFLHLEYIETVIPKCSHRNCNETLIAECPKHGKVDVTIERVNKDLLNAKLKTTLAAFNKIAPDIASMNHDINIYHKVQSNIEGIANVILKFVEPSKHKAALDAFSLVMSGGEISDAEFEVLDGEE